MSSHIDEAGHTKAFDYPVTVTGGSRNVQFCVWDSNWTDVLSVRVPHAELNISAFLPVL